MKKYLIYTTTNTKTKNRLQQAVSWALNDINRGTVWNDDLEDAEKKKISDFHFSLNDGQFSIHLYQFKEAAAI